MLTQTPVGLDEIIDTFGNLDIPNFEARYIVPFTLPYPLYYDGSKVTRARCHYLIVENFQHAFDSIQTAGLQDQVAIQWHLQSTTHPWPGFASLDTFVGNCN